MSTRRQTLKYVASSLFVSPFGVSAIAAAASQGRARASDPVCPTCTTSEELRGLFSNILDSAALLKLVSLPNVILPFRRSSKAGIPVQHVESATGSLAFAMSDIKLHAVPSISFVRYYRSDADRDSGVGAGWSIAFDDRIHIQGNTATILTASGDTVTLTSSDGGTSFETALPGLSVHRRITLQNDGSARESLSADFSRIYRNYGGIYFLSSFDYGALGLIDIHRDANGRITSIVNSGAGLSINMTWSPQHQLLAISDNAGRSVKFDYSGNLLTSHTDPTGAKWRYEYTNGALNRIIDPASTAILEVQYVNSKVSRTTTISGSLDYSYTHSTTGVLTNVQDAYGNITSYSHNPLGQLTNASSNSGVVEYASVGYDDKARVINTLNGTRLIQYSYDEQSRITSRQQGAYRKNWKFGSDGRVSEISDTSGSSRIAYDSDGGISGAVNSRGKRSYSAKRLNGRIAQMNGGGHVVAFTYNGSGQISSVLRRKSKLLQFGYNAAGFLIYERMGAGYSATARRNARGELTDWADSRGQQFSFVRDARGALVQISNTPGEWVRAKRDPKGRIVQLSNSTGQTRSFVYDESGMLTQWTDALGRVFAVSYEPGNRRASKMTQLNGGASFFRGHRSESKFRSDSSATATTDLTPGDAGDGWRDPLFAGGLLGSFSGYTRYAVLQTAKASAKSAPSAMAAALVAGAAEGEGDGDIDTGGDSGGGTGGDIDVGGTGGDFGDVDTGGDGPPFDTPSCDSCWSAYQSTCQNSLDDSTGGAQTLEVVALLACGAFTGAAAGICIVAAEAAYETSVHTAQTNFNNCTILIPQNCYSQCSP